MRFEHGYSGGMAQAPTRPRVTSGVRGNQTWTVNKSSPPIPSCAGSAYEGANFLACARTLFSYSTLFWQ